MNDVAPLSVSEITRALKFQIESRFPDVKIEGEVSNFKMQTSGHFYFSLKDAESQIAAVMFRGDAAQVKKIPKDGDKITVRGAVTVYGASGRYQIMVKELVHSGLGLLLLLLEELKVKLNKQGFFKKEHKKPLPKFPKIIGVITSPTGAVIQDILNVLSRRHTGFHVILNPVKVQGEGAAEEIASAINEMNHLKLCDVLIVGRGGGSIEDLWAFNDEGVANAIYNSEIPIIAAIGHETDHTIADYVADVRAPTPSAAAEIVLQESELLMKHLRQSKERLTIGIHNFLKHERQRLNGILRHPLFISPYALLGPFMQKLDKKHARLENLKPTAKIAHMKAHLAHLTKRIDATILNYHKQKSFKLYKTEDILKVIDPKNLLTKGYNILFSEKDGSVIKSVCSLKNNESVRILLSDGSARSTITEIHHD